MLLYGVCTWHVVLNARGLCRIILVQNYSGNAVVCLLLVCRIGRALVFLRACATGSQALGLKPVRQSVHSYHVSHAVSYAYGWYLLLDASGMYKVCSAGSQVLSLEPISQAAAELSCKGLAIPCLQ